MGSPKEKQSETRGAIGQGSGRDQDSGGVCVETGVYDGPFQETTGVNDNDGLLTKRVIFPMAGKGGIGKTVVMATLAEWFKSKSISVELLDMDPENKAEGSLSSLFSSATKLPAVETWTYDRLLGISMESRADVILADMGAAQAYRMIPWVQDFYRAAQQSGLPLRWTAIGVVDSDIASARSVLEWGLALQDTVDYIIVHNNCQQGASAWKDPMIAEDVKRFHVALNPVEIHMDARRPDLQSLMRSHCVTLGDVANRLTTVRELQSPDMMLRARTYRTAAFNQFTKARAVLLP